MVSLVACQNLTKTYGRGTLAEHALAGISLEWNPGEACLLLGPSGSGKTTLLSILGCLLSPSGGELSIAGSHVPRDSPRKLVSLRRYKIGFVFQHAQLLPFLTVEDNLRIVAANAGLRPADATRRVAEVVDRLGVAVYRKRKPAELSGGQRQRVAIARAVLHRPPIILADEPTAALDWENGQIAIQLLVEQARIEGSLLIVVTHDTRLVPRFDRVLYMESGRIMRDVRQEVAVPTNSPRGIRE